MSFWNGKALTAKDYFDAATAGYLEKVKECINNGMNTEAKNYAGWTALHFASDKGRLEIVRYLIEKCLVDKEAKDNGGWTPLHRASRNGHLDIVKYFVETCKVNKGAKNTNNRSAYDIAVTNNKSEVAQYLLKVMKSRPKRPAPTVEDYLQAACDGNLHKVSECISKGVDKEAKGNDGWTSLLYASFFGHLEIVKYLIETCNVDTGAKAYDGYTALHYASGNGSLEIVKYLIETCLIDTEAKDIYGQTAYDMAMTNNQSEVAQFLLEVMKSRPKRPAPTAEDYLQAVCDGNLDKVRECISKGVDKEAKGNDGWTSLLYGSFFGHLEIVKYLIETCNVDTGAMAYDGHTALHYASGNGSLEVVKYLIETCFVDTEAKDNDGHTALHCASDNGHLEIVKYLIETCLIDTEAKDIYGQSAYDMAMINNKSETAQYLLKVRSIPTSVTPQPTREQEIKTKQPTIPTGKEFFEAAKEGNLEKLKHCVNNGMNKEAKDNDEWTALHFASWKGHLEIVKYLIETCLVEKEAKNNLGSTALHIASRNGHLEMVKYLIETGQVNKEAKTKNGQSAYDIAVTYSNIKVVQYLLNVSDDSTTVIGNVNMSPTPLVKATIDMTNNPAAALSPVGPPPSSIGHLGVLHPNPLVLTSVSSKASVPAFELNEAWMMSLQIENQQLVNRLSQLDSSLQFISERRDMLDLIVVEKCMTIEEQDEQSAILESPDHRDFYLLLQRKLKCMIRSCETFSAGMAKVGGGDMRAFCARTINENGYDVFKTMKVGFFIASAIQWSKKNLAFVPFVDTIGSVFQVIVTLKDEHDRYMGLARVADFATMACLPHYGTTSLDVTIEKVARHFVRARIGSPTCKFVEKKDQFGKLKQLMINLLAASSNTPAKEQASKAADCAFAHIMKPSEDSVLFEVLNDSIRDVGLAEALAATILDISVQDLQQLEPFPMSPPPDTIRPTNDTPTGSVKAPIASVSNAVLNCMSVSKSLPLHSDAFASSQVVAEQVAKVQKQEEMIQQQNEMIQKQEEMMRKQNLTIQQLSRKMARLEKDTDNDSGGGTMYAKPEEVFKNEIAGMKNLKNDVEGLSNEVMTIDYQVAGNNLRILVLEERIQYLERIGLNEDVQLKQSNGNGKSRKGQ